MSVVTAMADGLRNIVANLGTARDKASQSTYVFNELSSEELSAMYRVSSLARKIIDMPAEDSLREWREWQADDDTISKLEAEENRLGMKRSLIRNAKRGRLFGGCAVFIGTGEADLTQELVPSRIGKGGLKYLTVVNRADLQAGELEADPRSPLYGTPKTYTMQTGSGPLTIHPSRLVIAQGAEVPEDRFSTRNQGWSDPILTSVLTDVRNLDATVANVASLVFEAKVDVFGISGFNEGLRSGGLAYEKTVLDRTGLVARAKSLNNAIVTDKEDVYSQKSASFQSMPDLLDRFMQLTSAAASIPMTLLFGMSPGGLNASGDSDTRGYYDRIKVIQTLEHQPAMSVLDECLIWSTLGSRPEDIFYNWRPLWQPTTKERAETGKIVADTFSLVNSTGLLPPEAVAKALVNGLTESGLAPGLEGHVAELEDFDGDGDDTDDDVEEGGIIPAAPTSSPPPKPTR